MSQFTDHAGSLCSWYSKQGSARNRAATQHQSIHAQFLYSLFPTKHATAYDACARAHSPSGPPRRRPAQASQPPCPRLERPRRRCAAAGTRSYAHLGPHAPPRRWPCSSRPSLRAHWPAPQQAHARTHRPRPGAAARRPHTHCREARPCTPIQLEVTEMSDSSAAAAVCVLTG